MTDVARLRTEELSPSLRFDNAFVRDLPGDKQPGNHRRQVHGALYSSVEPTPVAAPTLIAYSPEVADLLGLSKSQIESESFARIIGGNALVEGMEPFAANYGGRWDILQAMSRFLKENTEANEIQEEQLSPYLAMSYAPEPDLFVRTGGEQRISNFLLWQLAYAELYFTDTLWPDFDGAALDAAIASYRSRERRFGRTSEQLEQSKRADVA